MCVHNGLSKVSLCLWRAIELCERGLERRRWRELQVGQLRAVEREDCAEALELGDLRDRDAARDGAGARCRRRQRDEARDAGGPGPGLVGCVLSVGRNPRIAAVSRELGCLIELASLQGDRVQHTIGIRTGEQFLVCRECRCVVAAFPCERRHSAGQWQLSSPLRRRAAGRSSREGRRHRQIVSWSDPRPEPEHSRRFHQTKKGKDQGFNPRPLPCAFSRDRCDGLLGCRAARGFLELLQVRPEFDELRLDARIETTCRRAGRADRTRRTSCRRRRGRRRRRG